MAHRGGYAGAAHPPEVKATLGAVGSQLRARGWSVREVGQLFVDAGYSVGQRTLRDWSAAVDASWPITSPNKRTGALKELSFAQRQVADWFCRRTKKLIYGATAASSLTPLGWTSVTQLPRDIWLRLTLLDR